MSFLRRTLSWFLAVSISSALSLLSFVPLAPLFVEAQAQDATPFTDVTSIHPNLEAITYLKDKSVIKGYGDGNFLPDNTINRAEFMKIIIGSAVTNPAGGKCFKDVGEEWFAPYICEAKKRGIVDGYGDGTFRPDLNINIAEASKIVTKAFGLNTGAGAKTGGGDVPAAAGIWYKPFVTSLAAKSAIPVSIDYPEKKLTRGEMAEMAWRMKADVETKPTKTFETLTADLPNLTSCAELQEKISLQSYKQNRFAYPMMMKSMNVGAMPDSAPPTASAPAPAPTADSSTETGTGAAAEAFSSTNVQVEGVDEADIIKNDGQYIYLIKGRSIRIVQAIPATGMKELSRVTVEEKSFNPSEMFVDGNILVVVGNSYETDSQTVVYEYDVTDHSNVKQVRRVAFDGNYVSSRRIGNFAYFVMNAYPKYPQPMENVKMAAGVGTGGTSASGLVPLYTDSKTGKTMPVVGCSSIRVFPRYDEPNFLVVAGIPLNTSGEASITRQAYLGSGSTIYSSLDSLYVATQKYEYDEMKTYNIWAPPSGKPTTVFYRFGLKDGAISYKTHGSVDGTLLNQFSMDESGDNFRVAVSQGNFWGSNNVKTNQLYILDRNNLATVLGKVDDIGKGEQIKSVRFMGKRAYVVTFKKTDPFFVIDVANATAPKILGELKIPGYSDYLHPYDENHIIGFGKDAVDASLFPTDEATNMMPMSDFAWYQGMKLAMFDVTDPTAPKEMFKEAIGDRGTTSELLYNHKALLFDKNKGLLAFPVEVSEIKDKETAKISPSTYGETVFRGAYVYSVDLVKGFVLKGKITHEDPTVASDTSGGAASGNAKMAPAVSMMPIFQGTDAMIQRLLYIGQSLYSVSMKKVSANSLSDMSAQGSVDLAKEPDDGNRYDGFLPM